MDLDVKVSQVFFVRNGADSGNAVLFDIVSIGFQQSTGAYEESYGSAIRRSVSFTIRFGRAILGVPGSVRRRRK